MFKIISSLAVAVALALPGGVAMAYQLPTQVDVSTSYASGAGSVDFSKSAEVKGTFTVSDDYYDKGTWITAGDVANGASGFGFYALNGRLYTVSSGGGYVRRIFSGFFTPGTTIFVDAKYNAVEHVIRFDTQTRNPVLKMLEYTRGIVEDNIPEWGAVSADPLRVLLNPQTYGSTTLSVMSWSYTE